MTGIFVFVLNVRESFVKTFVRRRCGMTIVDIKCFLTLKRMEGQVKGGEGGVVWLSEYICRLLEIKS